jgi:hypothetical protein
MGVSITKPAPKSAVFSNKPLSASPDAEYYQASYVSNAGNVIWRSIPVPDKIAIVGFLLPEHFFHSEGTKSALAHSVADFVDGVGGLQVLQGNNSGFIGDQAKKLWGKFSIPFGDRNALVQIQVEKLTPKSSPNPAFRMRLGQWTTVPLRVPPQCEATCLVH